MENLSIVILEFFRKIESIIGSFPFLLSVISIAFTLKLFILVTTTSKIRKLEKSQKTWFLLILVLIGSMMSDLSWITKLIHTLFLSNFDYRLVRFSIYIAWGFAVIQYQALALFISNLPDKKNRIKIYQIIFLCFSTMLSVFFIGLAFYKFNHFEPNGRPAIENTMLTITSFYLLFPLMLSSLFITIWKIRTTNLPRILKRQIKILIQFIICPLLISDFIQFYPGFVPTTIIANFYSVVGLSTLLLTYAIFHCIRKIMGLRFLNLDNHVQSEKNFHFINDFKNILDQFSQVTNNKELIHITQNFFKNAFNIPTRRTRLHVRSTEKTNKSFENSTLLCSYDHDVENFINTYSQNTDLENFFIKNKVIINDELEFSNFYNDNETCKKIITFMNNISADIFIPIYEKQTLSAYIIVERYARINHENKNAPFYTNIERDQMEVFANYLGNIIKLLQSKNLETLIRNEKQLKEELYSKHQEINQYKESIRSFLRNTKQKKIGIIFYKNRRFTFGNQTAQELIQVKLNTHEGHPITKKLKKIAKQVLEYKSPQTCFINDNNEQQLVVSSIPNIENNNIIMIIYYPEISDILKKKIELLKDPTKWDYLLYLETTKSGKLINQLIPGNGETLLQFKINLLKISLSKKAILLDMPEQDLIPTVEILHHISLNETLHILDLQKPSKNIDTAVKLFGINPILGIKKADKPLLEKLNGSGTLFIKNIHLLNLETQKHLSEFIKYGFYRPLKGNTKISSKVRIICSTNINLKTEVQEGNFSQSLFNELNKTATSMPSLLTLPEEELENLTSGFTEQVIKTDEFQHILELTNSEKKRLTKSRPASFMELKIKIQKLLVKKSKKHEIYEEAQFDPAYDITDPELVEAVRLGKHALKDRKIITMLWGKFKNQNKIANLLGVNRSSVNRRCKEYNLIP